MAIFGRLNLSTQLIFHFDAAVVQSFNEGGLLRNLPNSSKMSSISRQTLKLASTALRPALQRNLATSYVLAQAAPVDPVQGLFLEKVREYATKKKASGGKLVDSDAKTEAMLATELGRVAKAYGGGEGVDMTKFPEIQWTEPELQSLELGAAK